MFWYIIAFTLIAVAAFAEDGRSRVSGKIAAVTLLVFGGLRYETGFDWVEYESFYNLVPGIGQDNIYTNISTIIVEPGYYWLNRLFKTFGASYQLLIFCIALINIGVLYIFCRRYTQYVAVVLLWYFGHLFLTGQMSTIRQSLSITFIYLMIMSWDRSRYVWAGVTAVLAVSFHTFSIIFLPVVMLRRSSPSFKVVALICGLGLVVAFGGINLFQYFATYIISIVDGGIISSKVALYAEFQGAALSPFALIMLFWNVGFYYVISKNIKSGSVSRDYITNFSLWCTLLSILSHTYLFSFPIVWNRIMLVTFVVQAIIYTKILLSSDSRIEKSAWPVSVFAVGALAPLLFTLSGPQSIVFKPYQSMIVVWTKGHYGDGRLRYLVIRKENDQIAEETRL